MEEEVRQFVNPEVITSLTNPLIKRVRSLAVRPADGLCVVFGKHLFEEAVKAKCVDTAFFVKDKAPADLPASLKTVFVSAAVMTKLAGTFVNQQVVALCKIPKGRLAGFARIILLDGIQDPGNVGSIIRTGYALGYDGIALLPGCADFTNPKTLAASKGAAFHVPVEKFSSLSDFRQKIALPIIGADNSGAAVLVEEFKPPAKFALAFGQEGRGLDLALVKACSAFVKVRQSGFDSLNVAAAAAIVAYALNKGI